MSGRVPAGMPRPPVGAPHPPDAGPGGLCRLLGLDQEDVAGLVAALGARSWTVASAESLTAGLFTAALTEIPGSSAVLRGGIVCYATDLKASLLGVGEELLRRTGPVDPQVAGQLAAGARARCGATLGVGLTGVAGPDPQNGLPAGTVFVAVASAAAVEVRRLTAPAVVSRWGVRAAAVRLAVAMVRRCLDQR